MIFDNIARSVIITVLLIINLDGIGSFQYEIDHHLNQTCGSKGIDGFNLISSNIQHIILHSI